MFLLQKIQRKKTRLLGPRRVLSHAERTPATCCRRILETAIPQGEEHVPRHLVSLILAICRLLNPSSELRIAEHFYRNTDRGMRSKENMEFMQSEGRRYIIGTPKASCEKLKNKEVMDRRIGRIQCQNGRTAGLFDIVVNDADGRVVVSWTKWAKSAWWMWCYRPRRAWRFANVVSRNRRSIRKYHCKDWV